MPALSPSGNYRFILPRPELRRYITTYYFFDIETPGGETLNDLLHPEWASARFTLQGSIDASIVPHPPEPVSPATMTGPTSRACNIGCHRAQMAGIGLLPTGWNRFVGQDASRYANLGFDLENEPTLSLFSGIWDAVKNERDYDSIAAIFDAHLYSVIGMPDPEEKDIEALHHALTSPDMEGVGQLADSVGMNIQQVERLCRRVFGFPPKRLLRRQRFLRSLAIRLLNPDQSWARAMDVQYHDQAHFNRDFHDFMGMSPRAYLAMPRPISKAATRARATALGQPLQVLHGPNHQR